ncbi:MAG: hypothetical protein NVS3B20_16550 [Polyangiales bacterium]
MHAAEATEAIVALLGQARHLDMKREDLLDSLLAMRHKLHALSRMKAHHVYRMDSLPRTQA